jgi:hypothetical protein
MVLDLFKTVVRLEAIILLPEPSYIEIGQCVDVVFGRVSCFVIEETVAVSIIVDLL